MLRSTGYTAWFMVSDFSRRIRNDWGRENGPSAVLLHANLQIWPQRDGGERDGAPMSKMRQSRSFGGEILTTP